MTSGGDPGDDDSDDDGNVGGGGGDADGASGAVSEAMGGDDEGDDEGGGGDGGDDSEGPAAKRHKKIKTKGKNAWRPSHMRAAKGRPVGMHGGGGLLVHQHVGSCAPGPLYPTGRRGSCDFAMGYLQSKLVADHFVSTTSCAPRVFCRASQSWGRKARVVSKYPSGGCKARPDRRLRTAVSSAGWAESLGLQGRIIITAHRTLVSGTLGVRGPASRSVLTVYGS